jgi:hypothetical protein
MGTIKRGFANNIKSGGTFDATTLNGTVPSTNVANTTLSSVTSVPASVGDLVQTTATDPSPVTAGDVWYNTTSRTLKAGVLQAAAWASGGNMPIAKNAGASDGTSTAAWTAGGSSTPAGNTGIAQTDLYNGTSWTTSGNLNTPRTYVDGLGTQTAAVASGGFIQPGAGPSRTMYTNTENFNGSTWTNSGALPTGIANAGMCGVQTAGLRFGGSGPYGSPSVATTLKYNGSTWTAANSMNTAGAYTRAGTQTAALATINNNTAGTGTESYNGTTWTAGTSRSIAGSQMAGFGLQTAAVVAGGYSAGPGTPQFSTSEYWNGTSWTTGGTLATARRLAMGIGSQNGTSGLVAGGTTPSPYISTTEAWNGASVVAKTVTTS